MSVYIVESPFQLLQAIERNKYTNEQGAVFFIRLNNSTRNNDQMHAVANLFNLEGVKYLNLKSKFYIVAYIYTLLNYLLRDNKVIFGDDNSFVFKLFRHLIPKKKVVLLDDGVATFNSIYMGDYERFTIFKNVNGVHNNFGKVRTIIFNGESKVRKDIIVGGKLVEEGICSKEVYHSIIEKMILHKSSESILYIPHRGEMDDNVRELQERFNINVFRNELPIELIGYEAAVEPVNIMSVLSTAVYSMSLIYRDSSFSIFPINVNDIDQRKNSIVKLYENMRRDFHFYE